jgi:hypothetical protein
LAKGVRVQILAFLQIALASTGGGGPSAATVSLFLSGGSLLAAVGSLWRLGMWAGRFVEFKENSERERKETREAAVTVVQRHEIETLGTHIDRRFDELSAQIAEIRKAQYNRHQSEGRA